MKLNSASQIAFKGILLLAIGFSTISFAEILGGDTYHIYLNKKLLFSYASSEKKLQLDKIKAGDRIEIVYSHCGVVGDSRRVIIKDQKNSTLKEWKFADGAKMSSMLIPTKELLQLKQSKSNGVLKLYYAAKQMPDAQVLAVIDAGNEDVALSGSAKQIAVKK